MNRRSRMRWVSGINGCIGMVAPLGPGAGVGLHPGVAEYLRRQVGKAGAVVGLAMSDHIPVRGDTQGLQLFDQVATQTQSALRVHAGGPFEIDGAGNMTTTGG